MGQTLSRCCPCASSEYTEIQDMDKSSHGEQKQLELQRQADREGEGQTHFQDSGEHGETRLRGPSASQLSSASHSQSHSLSQSQSQSLSQSHSQSQSLPPIDFDFNSSVFRGAVVQQKFFNKSTYEAKFAWINLKSRSLCLSEHMTKERRHKEASIGDVTGVICGPPEKFKAVIGSGSDAAQMQQMDANLCLSVKFVRGGGIDLKFATMKERDEWSEVILRLINSAKRSDGLLQ